MPEFRITAPNGEKFRVTAPEGATRDQAIAKVKERMDAQDPQSRQNVPAEDVPAAPPQPDGPDPAGANPLAAREPGGGVPNEQRYANPFTGEGAVRDLKVGAQGAGRGVADLLGLPVDLAALGLNTASYGAEKGANLFLNDENEISTPRITDPIGGSNSIADLVSRGAEAVGYDVIPPEEMDSGERLGYNMNRLGTEAVTGGAGLARGAARRFADNVASQKPSAGDALMRPYREQPGGTLAADTAAGAGSGAGLTAAQEAFPDNSIAALTGALLGGIGGGTVATDGTNIPGAVADRVRGKRTDPGVKYDEKGEPTQRRIADEAARQMQETYRDPQQAIRNYDENVAAAGDVENTLPFGIMSDDIGGIGMEQYLRGQNRQPFIENQTDVMAEGSQRLSDVGPRVSNTRAATDYANRQGAGAEETAQREVDALRGRAYGAETAQARAQAEGREAAQGTVPLRNAEAAKGEASRDFSESVIERGLDPMTQNKNDRFNAPDPRGTLQQDITPLAQTVEQVNAGVNKLRNAGEQVPSGVMDRVERVTQSVEEGETPTASWKDLSELRRDLSSIRDKARKNRDFDLADSTKDLQRGIDQIADRIRAEGGEAGQAIDEANRYYRDVYAPVFAQGQGKKLRDDVQTSGDRMESERSNILNRYYLTESKNTQEVAQDLERITQASQTPAEAQDAVRRYLVADMSKAFDGDGNVNLKALRTWRDKRSEILSQEQFKPIRQEVDQFIRGQVNNRKEVGNLGERAKEYARELRKAEGQKGARVRAQTGSLELLMDKSPAKAAQSVFSSNDPQRAMRDVVKRLKGSPEALKAWQRNVADHMAGKVFSKQRLPEDQASTKVNDLREFFDQNRETLSEVYTPEQMNTLQQVYQQLRPLNSLNLQANPGSATAERVFQAEKGAYDKALKLTEVGAKSLFGILRGGGITRTGRLAAEQAFPDRSPEVVQLLSRAQFDPELAKYLLTKDPKKTGIQQYNTGLNRIISGQAGAREANDGDEGTRINVNRFNQEQGGPRAQETSQ